MITHIMSHSLRVYRASQTTMLWICSAVTLFCFIIHEKLLSQWDKPNFCEKKKNCLARIIIQFFQRNCEWTPDKFRTLFLCCCNCFDKRQVLILFIIFFKSTRQIERNKLQTGTHKLVHIVKFSYIFFQKEKKIENIFMCAKVCCE